MRTNQKSWLDLLLSQEIEGAGFVDDPNDNARYSKYGVTLAALCDYHDDKTLTVEDLKKVDRETACAIAIADYWAAVGGDALPAGLDVLAADFAYNSGPRRAVKALQGLLEVPQDGYAGPDTTSAARKAKQAELCNAYADARMDFLMALDDWPTFGRGWTNRVRKMRQLALSLVQPYPALADAAKSPTVLVAGAVGAGAVAVTTSDLMMPMEPVQPEITIPSTGMGKLDELRAQVEQLGLGEWEPVVTATLAVTVIARRILGFRRSSYTPVWRR